MARLKLPGLLIVTILSLLLMAAGLPGCAPVIQTTGTGTTSTSASPETTTASGTTRSEPTSSETTGTETTATETSATETSATETSATETTHTTTEPAPTPSDGQVTYTVKAGDTLFSIARLFQVTVQQIVDVNHIADPDRINVGQVLLIPADGTGPSPGDFNDLDNTSIGWWYQVPNPLGEDKPAAISDPTSRLLAKYGAIWQMAGSGRKVVYITMDAGYEYDGNTTKILDIASDKQVQISFFITGSFMANNPETVLRMVREGHQVCNHTEKHLNQPKALSTSLESLTQDIIAAEDRFRELAGQSFAPYLRPPEGVYSERSLAVIQSLGYQAVFWSFAYADWKTDEQPDPEKAYDKVMGQLHPGSILLLHTVSSTNVRILGRLIDGIRERGYVIELLP